MTIYFHIQIIGLLLLLLGVIHIAFPRYFKWKEELSALSLINEQMMKWHTFFIALVVFLMGVLCLTSAQELVDTSLGKKILVGFGIFWGIRLLVQFVGYSRRLWKGKAFETTIHVVFSILWAYITVVFFLGAS